MFRQGPLIERAMSNLDAAEATLLNVASSTYVLGQMPCVLRHVQCHLTPTDPRRQELERIARRLGLKDADQSAGPDMCEKEKIVDQERGKIVTAMRGASSAALRE